MTVCLPCTQRVDPVCQLAGRQGPRAVLLHGGSANRLGGGAHHHGKARLTCAAHGRSVVVHDSTIHRDGDGGGCRFGGERPAAHHKTDRSPLTTTNHAFKRHLPHPSVPARRSSPMSSDRKSNRLSNLHEPEN